MRIDRDSIRELRDRTGLGLSDCKKALEDCGGNIEKAINRLRIIGLGKIEKKSNRVASNGLIAMHLDESYGVLVELNCETDFVARNSKFIELASNLALIACQERCDSIGKLKNTKYINIYDTIREAIVNSTLVLGEKLVLSNLCFLETKDGIIAGYVHGDTPNLGRSGALVALQSPGNKKELGKQIAMHIVAMKPEAMSVIDLDKIRVSKELSIVEEQVKNLNKTEQLTKKIVDSRMTKYYEEVALLEQRFIKNDKIKVADFIKLNSIKLFDYKLLSLGSST